VDPGRRLGDETWRRPPHNPTPPWKAYLAQKGVNSSAAHVCQGGASSPAGLCMPDQKCSRPEGRVASPRVRENQLPGMRHRSRREAGIAADNAYRDAANDLQLRFFTSEPDYPRFEGAPYAIHMERSAARRSFFTTMAQFKPGGVANHRGFAGYYGPEALASIIEARNGAGPGRRARMTISGPISGLCRHIARAPAAARSPSLRAAPVLRWIPIPRASRRSRCPRRH
jgi:hypothetical protein